MLNTYNNLGSLDVSDIHVKYILEMIHQINLRLPSIMFEYSSFMDVIIDEDCLLGNPWGHKYIHKSGQCLRRGKYFVYYSTKYDYYVIEAKAIVPLGILRRISKGDKFVDIDILTEIGRRYADDMEAAFMTIAKDQKKRTGGSYICYHNGGGSEIETEIRHIAASVLYYGPDQFLQRTTGIRPDSKYRAPLTMILRMMYATLNDSCKNNHADCLKLIEPIYHYPKNDENMTSILSYIMMLESCEPNTKPVYHIQYCWDAIERCIKEINMFIPEDIPGKINGDEQFANSHYPELNDTRVYRLYNLVIHLYLHEIGHTILGFENEEETDKFAKKERTAIKSVIRFRCPWIETIFRKFFENYSHFMDEVSLFN